MNDSQHDWFRDHMNPAWAGLLTGDDEQRFEEHRRSCASCRRDWDEFTGSEENGAASLIDHIPADLLAEWDRSRSSLRGLERSLVRRHLAQCSECREDLQRLGFRPELPVVPELESEHVPEPVRMPPSLPRSSRSGVTTWLVAGWATAATAALAWTMFIGPIRQPTREVRELPSLPSMESQNVSRAPRVALTEAPPQLESSSRGAPSEPIAITFDPAIPYVSVAVPPLDVSDEATVALEVMAPDGRLLASTSRRQSEFFPRKVVTIDGGDAGLSSGVYVIRLRAESPPGSLLTTPEQAEYRFALQRKPS